MCPFLGNVLRNFLYPQVVNYETDIPFRLDVAPVLYNPVWSGNVFSFQFNARSNVVYQPQFKSSFADSNWTALPSLTGQRGVATVTDTSPPAAPRFCRVAGGVP